MGLLQLQGEVSAGRTICLGQPGWVSLCRSNTGLESSRDIPFVSCSSPCVATVPDSGSAPRHVQSGTQEDGVASIWIFPVAQTEEVLALKPATWKRHMPLLTFHQPKWIQVPRLIAIGWGKYHSSTGTGTKCGFWRSNTVYHTTWEKWTLESVILVSDNYSVQTSS